MSGVAGRRDERAGSATEIECDELQPTEAEAEPGWRRLLKPGPPALAPVPPTLSLQDLAQSKEAAANGEERPPSTLAGHVMWKLAMRMSNHYESRLLQHISRSILSRNGQKNPDRKPSFQGLLKEESDGENDSTTQQTKPKRTSRSGIPGLRRIEDGSTSQKNGPMNPDAAACPETGRPASATSAAAAAAAAGAASASSAAGILPPFPPLVFSPTKGRTQKRARGMTLKQYINWGYPGLRPGLSVRVVRCETVSAMPAVTEYVVHVVDLHTRVFWITKKRFSDFYFLRRKVRGIIRHAPEADDEEKDYLKFLLDLPFPRRRFRPASATAINRGMVEIEVFLRNLASLEPHSKLQRSILKELQLEMCSDEFVSSLEKIDTTGELAEPKWLSYDLFRRLNCEGAVEGSTCYKFLQVFRNRVATIESTLCTHCNKFEGAVLAATAVGDLRNTVTSIEKYIGEHLDPQYADTLSLLDQSVNVPSILEDCIFHAVEDTVVVPLEKQVAFLVGTTVDKEAEQRLVRNIERLRCRSQTESGIPEHLQSDDDWGLSCHHLSMIDERALPVDKIQELLRSALEIFKNCGEKNLEWHDNSALTADDYLPIHIYVVVNSGLKRPLATKELLGAMIHPSLMLGEVGYFLTMFEECAEKLEKNEQQLLDAYGSMLEDLEFAATPEASQLFAEGSCCNQVEEVAASGKVTFI
ncbi:VPS9 domain containing 1 [Phytophthora boehmeriae]|uniref:VPS9 domain containing 1 n=1 Tax=Phytophthora boehmeriae TaxID=109152 RepID=A0A8T1X710_9STRA|nr:VPS9 domain containing 1 [Phytophthora boehmeriae]